MMMILYYVSFIKDFVSMVMAFFSWLMVGGWKFNMMSTSRKWEIRWMEKDKWCKRRGDKVDLKIFVCKGVKINVLVFFFCVKHLKLVVHILLFFHCIGCMIV